MDNTAIETKILDFFEDHILEAISLINSNFKQSSVENIKSYRIVIVGGYAMHQYSSFELLKTHDIDARIISIDPAIIEKIANKDQDELLSLYRAKIIAINSIVSQLNKVLIEKPGYINTIKTSTGAKIIPTLLEDGTKSYFFQRYLQFNRNEDVSGICDPTNFTFVKEIRLNQMKLENINSKNFCASKLSACLFSYSLNEEIFTPGIFDLVPHTPYDRSTFNFSNIQELSMNDNDIGIIEKWWTRTYPPDFTRNQENYGFVSYILDSNNITEIRKNVFIAGIGYIIWDTVYMINVCLQQLSELTSEDEYVDRLVKSKFNRYIKKYILFLQALDQPVNYLKCSPLNNFIKDCVSREEINDKSIE